MILSLYLLLIVIATLGTAVVIVSGTEGAIGPVTVDRRTGMVISALVFALWGVVGLSSFEVIVYSGGQQSTESFDPIAFLAAIGAAAALYSMFQASVKEIQSTGGI